MSRVAPSFQPGVRRWLATAALLMAACQSSLSAPDAATNGAALDVGVFAPSDTGPRFLAPAPDAPPIATPVVSFWAKVGEERRVSMYYAARPGGGDSTEFLRFRVRKRSLALWPDGTPFAPGDSVLITLTLVNAATLEVEFQPAGLTFSAANPADLKMSYFETDDDLNGDGAVTLADARIERRLALWKRETPSAPWLRQVSVLSVGLDEVETKVFGFTSYAIAW